MVGEKVMPRRIKLETVAPDGAVRNEALRIGPYRRGIQVP